MRKLLFSVLFLLYSSFILSAGNILWNITPETSVVTGRSSEIVYPVGIDHVNKYLSRLDWDIKPAWLIGLGASMETEKHFRVYADFQTAMPFSSGKMYDYDWLYTNLTDWSHRSEHNITLGFSFIGDIGADKSFAAGENWLVSLGIGYHLDWWSWHDAMIQSVYTTENGNIYPNPPAPYQDGDPFRNSIHSYNGIESINYRIAYHIPYVSLVYKFTGRKAGFSGVFKIGPVIANGLDYHILRGLYFYDLGIGGPWLSLDIRTMFLLSRRGKFYFSAGGVWIPEFSGSTSYFDEYGSDLGTVAGGGGFSFWRVNASIGYIFDI